MSTPTKEQKTAIEIDVNNIIVSAGAGSGKTFVLKERVLREVQNNHPINKFIILTFTNKAANEMKDRIRKILTENNVSDANYVDSAYIATFDSFAHSLVKKYNYLLNMDRNFDLIDSSIVKTELKRLLDEILEKKYKEKDDKFIHLITNMCYKDDTNLRNSIINLYTKLGNIVNKDEFLNIDKYYEDNFINEKINEYENNIFNDLDVVREYIEMSVDNTDKEKAKEHNQSVLNMINSISSIDEIIDNKDNFKLANNSNGNYIDSDEQKRINDLNTNAKKKLFSSLTYYKKDLINQYKSTFNDVQVIKDILLELDNKINAFKKNHNAYEFSDIAFKAIELVRDHEDIRNEIKNNTYEIMIDEYQDTNDIQEEFISYISNNNVYMVGDVKQSIYGFRNANPKLFKSKYNNYAENNGGIKIDLTKNFRSRKEVVNNINDLFSKLMFIDIGGAAYKESHIMDFDDSFYGENKDKEYDYNLSVLSYSNEDKKYRKDLIEAYIIAEDINKRMNENRHAVHEKSFDKLSYKDFCILVDKAANFETLKSVLESKGIPAYISKELSIKNDDEIYILKNLITCLTCISRNDYGKKFFHAYASIARSYIISMTDQELYDAIKNNDYTNTSLFIKLKEISKDIDSLSNKEILYRLINEFDIINKTINVSSVDERLAKLEYFINQAESLNKFGLDIYSMEEYFSDVINSTDNDIKIEIEQNDLDAVNIMTIHGSKGLEFNYVYMPYLNSKFKLDDGDSYILDNNLGILIPFYDDGIDKTFMYKLYKQRNIKETISEKIRLFYVGITRAKEQIIFVSDLNSKLESKINPTSNDLLQCTSFVDFLQLVKYDISNNIDEIDVNNLGIVNTYSKKDINYLDLIDKSNESLNISELTIDNKQLESKHFSHELDNLMTEELHNILDLGTRMHYAYEVCDFKNNNIDELNISDEEKQYLRNFLKHDEVKNIKDATIYKEHEIRYKTNNSIMHGFIDLLLKYDDHFDIIDYKTSNIDNPEYAKQLSGYKEYIENKYKLPTNIYLYSIKQDKFKKL